MAKAIAAYVAIGLGMIGAGTAHASDRELRAILDRLACVPERIVSDKMSGALVIYEVSCKRTDRVLQIACLESECWHLTPRPPDDDEQGS